MMAVRGLAQSVLDLIFPPVCLSCGAETVRSGLICAACFREMTPITLSCRHCALPLPAPDYVDSHGHCAQCAQNRFSWHKAHAAFLYEGTARSLILRFKYGDRLDIAPFLARAMATAIQDELGGADMLVPVPLHRYRFWKRRFNQAALLARHLGKAFPGLDHLPDALLRQHPTPSLARLMPHERGAVLEKAFRVNERVAARLRDRHILLVDDILTTGSTASICARQLLRAGAKRVDLLVAARTVKLAEARSFYEEA